MLLRDLPGRYLLSGQSGLLGLWGLPGLLGRYLPADLRDLPRLPGLPACSVAVPALSGLAARQARDGSVLSLPEVALADAACAAVLVALERPGRDREDCGVTP